MVRQKTLKDKIKNVYPKALIKYLPVKSTFKLGDTLRYSDCRKVKAFVVTQNIKVGDDVIDIETGESHEVYGQNTFHWLGLRDEELVNKKDGYKILREVSPNAMFVKGGKEYEVKPYRKSVEKEARQCDSDIEWEVNSGNSDARCFKKHNLTFGGFKEKRNTKVCNDCPYNNLKAIVEIEEIRYKVKCPCCGGWK